jgi:hypothetical protein
MLVIVSERGPLLLWSKIIEKSALGEPRYTHLETLSLSSARRSGAKLSWILVRAFRAALRPRAGVGEKASSSTEASSSLMSSSSLGSDSPSKSLSFEPLLGVAAN